MSVSLIAFLVEVAVLLAAGGYLEHKFGSKISSRVAALEERVTRAEGKAAVVAAAVKANV